MKLRVKLPLVYTLLIATLGMAFIVFTSRLVEERMIEGEREHFGSLAKTLAMNAANAIVLRDYAALRDFVNSVANHGEHVSYAIILDEGGAVLAHSRPELEGKILADSVSRAAAAAEGLLMQPAADALDVTAPLQIAGRKWGAVRIGYSLTDMQQKVADARNLVLLAGLLATLAGAAVAVFIAGRITGRLHALHRGTEIIGAGDLNYRLADSAGDEIGQLAAAFNTMTGHLRKNYQAIEQAKREWETSLDAVSDPLFIHDRAFRVLRCNRAYAEAAGMPFKKIIGRPYYEVFPKMNGPMEGCRQALERQWENNDNKIYAPAMDKIFNAKFFPIRDAGGAYLYSLHILQDVTAKKKAEKELHELFLAALQSLASAIEAKSPWTRGHSERVAGYAVKIGEGLGLAEDELEKLRIAALLHDIGKIGIYDDILNKQEKLTDAEYETLKQHSARGAEMLAPIRQMQDILPGVRGHHERYDGKGYPDGLKGEAIPLAARILAVADTFDSMSAERPYRPTPGKAQALEEIERHAGTQFDPRVVRAFLRTKPLTIPPPDGKNHVTEAIREQERS